MKKVGEHLYQLAAAQSTHIDQKTFIELFDDVCKHTTSLTEFAQGLSAAIDAHHQHQCWIHALATREKVAVDYVESCVHTIWHTDTSNGLSEAERHKKLLRHIRHAKDVVAA
jgi:uncharacterized protein with HEPN domain